VNPVRIRAVLTVKQETGNQRIWVLEIQVNASTSTPTRL
jgi:hypothetical protein